MRWFPIALTVVSVFSFNQASADSSLKVQQMQHGWIGLARQADPFDSSDLQVMQISKDGFTFRCGELNMAARTTGYESLSIRSNLRYQVDDRDPVDKTGHYSTYLGGDDLVTDSRYYSFRMNSNDIQAMKAGYSVKVAGKFGNLGWTTETLNLIGFTLAYEQMCD